MTTVAWTISTLDRRISDGFVTTAHWQANAFDGEHHARAYSTCSWSEGQPTIPYDDLTKEQVLEWVWASGVDKDAVEAALVKQIDAQKNPVQSSGLPWSTTTV